MKVFPTISFLFFVGVWLDEVEKLILVIIPPVQMFAQTILITLDGPEIAKLFVDSEVLVFLLRSAKK